MPGDCGAQEQQVLVSAAGRGWLVVQGRRVGQPPCGSRGHVHVAAAMQPLLISLCHLLLLACHPLPTLTLPTCTPLPAHPQPGVHQGGGGRGGSCDRLCGPDQAAPPLAERYLLCHDLHAVQLAAHLDGEPPQVHCCVALGGGAGRWSPCRHCSTAALHAPAAHPLHAGRMLHTHLLLHPAVTNTPPLPLLPTAASCASACCPWSLCTS